MALTGKLVADFEPFYAAVQKADSTIKTFEADANKVGTSLERMTNSFSGKKVIQDAALMERAFEQLATEGIGLTATELARMGKTADEAAAKLRAMGKDVPPGLQKISDAAAAANKSTDDWKGSLSGLAGSLGVAFSVGAVVSFAKSVVDLGGEITDTSQRLGISTDAVQGFKYAAELSGSTIDAVGVSLNKLSLNLAKGDGSTVGALKDLGLKFSDIRSMKPEDAFLAVTDALEKQKDPMEQVRLGTALMGKGFSDILPAVKAGFRGVSDGATKMSADTVAALDTAGDALTTFQTNIKVWAAESYNYARGFFDKFISETYRMIATAYDAAAGLAALAAKLPGAKMIGLDQGFIDSLKGQSQWYRDAATAMDLQTAAAKKVADAHNKLAPAIHASKEETDAAEKSAKAYQAQLDKYSGAAATASLKELDRVFRDLTASGKLTDTSMAAIAKEAESLYKAGGTLTPTLQALVIATGDFGPGLEKAALNMKGLGDQIAIEIPKLDALGEALKKMAALPESTIIPKPKGGFIEIPAPKPPPPLPPTFFDQLFPPEKMGAALASSILGAIQGGGNPVAAAAGTLGSSIGSNLAGSLKKDGTKMFTGALGGIFSAALPIVGSLLGPLTEALWGKLFGSAGRDAVKDFAASFGGFDALHLQLNTLGAEGEQLWINLTQGVGKNNPQQAKAAIDAITTALDKQQASQEDTTVTTEAQAQATIETAAEAARALDNINERLVTNRDAWGEWSVAVTGYLQTVANAVRATSIPSPSTSQPSPSFGGGGSGSGLYTPPPTPTTTGGGTAQLIVDGRTLAEVLVPALPGVITRYGLGRG